MNRIPALDALCDRAISISAEAIRVWIGRRGITPNQAQLEGLVAYIKRHLSGAMEEGVKDFKDANAVGMDAVGMASFHASCSQCGVNACISVFEA